MIRLNDEQVLSEEEEVMKAFQVFDANGDGHITCNEFTYILCNLGDDRFTKEECADIFKEADLDRSGRLNYKEFVDFWKNR